MALPQPSCCFRDPHQMRLVSKMVGTKPIPRRNSRLGVASLALLLIPFGWGCRRKRWQQAQRCADRDFISAYQGWFW